MKVTSKHVRSNEYEPNNQRVPVKQSNDVRRVGICAAASVSMP
jgi:hypothetical protein